MSATGEAEMSSKRSNRWLIAISLTNTLLLLTLIAVLTLRDSPARTAPIPTVAALPPATLQSLVRPTLPPIWTATPTPTFEFGPLPTFALTRFPPEGRSFSQCLTQGAWEDLWGYLLARYIRGWEQSLYCCNRPLDEYRSEQHCLPLRRNVRVIMSRASPTFRPIATRYLSPTPAPAAQSAG